MSILEPGERDGVASGLLSHRHSIPMTLLLHLLPGVPIVAAYIWVAMPVSRLLGFPPHLGWVIAMCLALAPVQLGLLYHLGRRRNGRLSLRGVVGYRERPTSRGRLIGVIAVLTAAVFVASFVLTPVDTLLYEALSPWIPLQATGGDGFIAGYPRHTVIATLAFSVVLTGVLLPVVEELYFRGYLLPRIAHLGGWAPVLNTVLFSLYHFWTPWQFVSRVGFFLPTVWLTWRHKDLRISLWVHCAANTILQLAVLLAIVLGFS